MLDELDGVDLTREWVSERISAGHDYVPCASVPVADEEGQISYRELEVLALVDEFMTFEELDPDRAFTKARSVVDDLRWYCLEWDGNALAEGNISAMGDGLPF